MTETLDDWLQIWKDGKPHLVHYKGRPIANPKKAFYETAVSAGLVSPDEPYRIDRAVTPYTLRRTMARLLRAHGVSLADIGAMLGHAVPGFTTTELYADADPNFLKPVVEGIEAILDQISTHTKTAPMRVRGIDCTHIAPTSRSRTNVWTGQKGRDPQVSLGVSVVGATRIELVTPSMSRKCSPAELSARSTAGDGGPS